MKRKKSERFWKEKSTQEEEKNKLEKQQQELEQKEKDLEEEDQNKNPSSIILKKFESIPNFNTKQNLEALIEPVKNNPNFLQQLQAKNIQSLVSLIVDKSPQEIIITVKRFEYDQEKEKEKKIKAYYHLKPNEVLNDEQINNYLYQEAIGQITSSSENPSNENKLLIPLILGGGLLILFGAIVIRIKLKRR